MKKAIFILLLLLPFCAIAQTDEMRVYTVAGNDTATIFILGDGGPATLAGMSGTEGVWIDNKCNIYFSDMGENRIRKVTTATGIITTVAGTKSGYSGDGGPATNAKLKGPYGIYVDSIGNIFIAEAAYPNNRVRKVDAVTGIITTFAGGGSLLADGIPATSIQLNLPQNVYGDGKGNIYIAERGRIRKVNTSGIISTIAGTGVIGLSGDGGPATSAQIGGGTAGMLFDASGNLIIADRGNCRIRKINKTTGIITTIAGTTDGYSGDNGPATNAQLSGPISFVIDNYGNLVIGDNGNNYLRKVDAITGIITTIAGVGTSITGNTSNGAPATSAEIHPEFLYLDLQGNIYFSNYGGDIRKITNYNPGLGNSGSNCGPPNETHNIISKNIQAIELYPNPATNELHIKMLQGAYNTFNITNSIGQVMIQQHILSTETSVPVNALPVGMYYILFKGEHGVEVKRFMKE